MDNLPVILIVTSKQCGVCVNMRGTGPIKEKAKKDTPPSISGKYFWDVDFFKLLLSGGDIRNGQQFRVYEIYLPTMGDVDLDSSTELNEFRLVDGKIIRFSLKNTDNKLNFTKDIDTKTNVGASSAEYKSLFGDRKTFSDIINSKIPSDVVPKLIAYFPSFLFFDALIWNNRSKIIGYIPGVDVIEKDGKYFANREKRPNPPSYETPIYNAQRFLNGGKENFLLSKYPIVEEKKLIVKEELKEEITPDKGSTCVKLRYKIIGK